MDEPEQVRAGDVELASNRLLALDEPRGSWTVRSGRIAVFTLLHDGASAVGPRRYRFDRVAGQALFGVASSLADGRAVRVLALALEPTVLRRFDADLVAEADGPLVADWIGSWSRALGRVFDAAEPSAPRERLASFQAELASHLLATQADERREESERLAASERLARRAAASAVGGLASVLDPSSAPPVRGLPLASAVREVASALGVDVRPSFEPEWGSETSEQVEAVARSARLGQRQVLLHDGWWRQDCGPILAFSRTDRRAVALVRRGRSYHLFDPASGERRRVVAATAAELDPQAFVFYAPLPDDASRATSLLRFALRGRGRDLVSIFASGLGATLLGMFVPQALALLVDDAIPDADRRLVIDLALALVAAACGAALFRLAQGLALLRLETGADAATQAAVWRRLLDLEASFFRRFSTGDLQSRITAVSQIRARIGGTTLRSLFSSVILSLNLLLLLHYSPRLTVVALAVAAASTLATLVGGTAILRFARRILELQGRFFGLMVQLLNGVAKLRVAAAEERAFGRWAADFATLARLELGRQRVQDTISAVNFALGAASTIALFAFAANVVGSPSGGMTTGVFLAFYVAYGTFIGAISTLSNTVIDVMAIKILRERARPILEARPESSAGRGSPAVLSGRLALEQVTFHYREDGPPVLSDVSFAVEPGEFVGLVGPSGGGKSTLFRLLLGFESPRSGSVSYDGRDLSGLDLHAVRRQLGVVLQAGRIGAGSIFDNIAAGSRVTLADAWEAARAAGLAEEIEALPMGLHTVISEGGTNLSGGQRQRLLLARALVHRPRILLLDEATSALDNHTQRIVSDSLEALDVTRVVIAHRLSTIRQADRIYVLEAGRLVQRGRFEELAAQDGPFARLVARQSC